MLAVDSENKLFFYFVCNKKKKNDRFALKQSLSLFLYVFVFFFSLLYYYYIHLGINQ